MLRTVPTIGSAHTFCASRKSWFKHTLGLTLTQSTTLLMKAKFSYCDQIKFNEPVLELGTLSGIRTHDLCDAGAVLSQLSYQSHMRAGIFSGLCSSRVTAALALMTVNTQLLLMDKTNFHSSLYLGQV